VIEPRFRSGTVQAANPGDHTQGQGRQHHDDIGRVGSVYGGLARLFRLLRNARGAGRAHSLGPAAATGSSLAPVALALGLSHGAKPFASGSPMPTSNRSAFHLCLERVSATSRTAVYGRVRTVVWEGRSREAPPIPIHLDRPWRATSIFHDSVAGGHASAASSRRKPPPSLDARR